MNRRGFLAMLAGAAFDPERALWVPGRKLISIPPPSAGLCVRVIKTKAYDWIADRDGFSLRTPQRDLYNIAIANTKLRLPSSGEVQYLAYKDDLSVSGADEYICRILRGPLVSDAAREAIHQIRYASQPHSMIYLRWYNHSIPAEALSPQNWHIPQMVERDTWPTDTANDVMYLSPRTFPVAHRV